MGLELNRAGLERQLQETVSEIHASLEQRCSLMEAQLEAMQHDGQQRLAILAADQVSRPEQAPAAASR